MKIAELRAVLKKHSKPELEFLVAELYKLVPNAKKEDYQIDQLIQKPVKEKKVIKKTLGRPIEDIAIDVKFFHENAIAQNYLIPNKIISKKERPKWRFVVKRLFKEIIEAEKNANATLRCGQELQVLYETLTHACAWQIFSAYDPFESVGIAQTDFFEQIVKFYRKSMDIGDFITKGIRLVIDNELNRYTLYRNLMELFIIYCETAPMKELAIEKLKELWEIKNKQHAKKDSWRNEEFYKNEKLNNYTEFIFRFHGHLFNFEEAIKFFNANFIDRDAEIKLYVLIRLLFGFNEKDLIKRELKANKGIDLRDSLVDLLNFIEQNDKLPDYL